MRRTACPSRRRSRSPPCPPGRRPPSSPGSPPGPAGPGGRRRRIPGRRGRRAPIMLRSRPMSVAFTAGTASSSAEVKSSSVMPYLSWSSFITASFTRPDSSASPMGWLPSSRFSVSPGMASPRVFLFCSAPRWGSRSVITSRGSPLVGADIHLYGGAVPQRRDAMELQGDGDPLVFADAAVVMGLEVGQLPVLIQGIGLQVQPGGVDVGGGDLTPLRQRPLSDPGQQHALAPVGDVDLVTGGGAPSPGYRGGNRRPQPAGWPPRRTAARSFRHPETPCRQRSMSPWLRVLRRGAGRSRSSGRRGAAPSAP